MPSKQENKRFNHVFRTHKNNQILYTLQLSHFSLIFRHLQKRLCYFYHERLYYLSKREEIVFRRIMSRKWLSELRKCASDGTFHLLRRPNERGKRQVEEEHKG